MVTPAKEATNTLSIRHRPRWQLVSLLRQAGVTQEHIAGRVGVTRSFVSKVLSRTASRKPNRTTEAVWREVEKAVAHLIAS